MGALSDYLGRRKGLTILGYGLRQSLDTGGAFAGPLIAIGLMLLWANDYQAVFWVAAIPAALAVGLLIFGVSEPERPVTEARRNPISRDALRQLDRVYWWVVILGAIFTLVSRLGNPFIYFQ